MDANACGNRHIDGLAHKGRLQSVWSGDRGKQMTGCAIPLVVGTRIRRDYNIRICSPVAMPATDRYRRRGWFVTINNEDAGTFYYMGRDGKVQAAGHGYRTPSSQVTLEVL